MVARLAAEQWGVVSTAELLECGLSHQAIGRCRRRGQLHRLYVGVWAVGHPNPPPEGRLLAAVKACGPTAVLSHHAAAAVWGIIEPFDMRPELTVASPRTRAHPGIVVHRSARLGPEDLTRLDGMPVTSPARTLLDLAAVLDGVPLRQGVRRAQGLHRVNVRQLVAICGRLGPCRGSRRLANVVATGPAPTRSVLEDVTLDLLLAARFVHPAVNQPLMLDGRRVVPDFSWPEQRLVLEADGAAWHDQKIAREDDSKRQALLERHGYRVLRVTWEQAVRRPAETVDRLRAAGAPLAAE